MVRRASGALRVLNILDFTPATTEGEFMFLTIPKRQQAKNKIITTEKNSKVELSLMAFGES